MKVELTRFKIKKGKENVAEEWMKLLNERIKDVAETMDREKMYVEAIFEETINNEKYLTWFSVSEDDGARVMTSDFEIDKMHVKYWRECIDDAAPGEDHKLKLFLLNNKIKKML